MVYVPWWSTYADDLGSFLTFFFLTMTGSLTLYCYYKAINTAPGSPPPEWVGLARRSEYVPSADRSPRNRRAPRPKS